MALIHMNDGRVWPLPRPLSLKNASIDIIRMREGDIHIGPSFTDTHKGTVAHMRAPQSSIEAANIPSLASWIIYPAYQAGAALSSTPITPCQSALRLADESFNFPLLGRKGFEILTDIAFECDSFDLRYSDLDEAIAWFEDRSENRNPE